MKVNNDDVEKVLALFDKEDIPYINFDYLYDNNIIEIEEEKKDTNDMVMKLGGNNVK